MRKALLVLVAILAVGMLLAVEEITFWHTYSTNSGEYNLLTAKIIPEFEKAHPDIKVKETQVNYNDMRQRLIVGTAAGVLGDVIRMDIIWVPQFAEIEMLVPVDIVFAEDFAKVKDGFLPGPLSTCEWKGHYYGLPLDTNTQVLLWNRKLFEEVGLSEGPKTMDEFIKYAKLLTKDKNGDGQNDQWGYADGGLGPWNTIPWIYSFGGHILDSTNQKAEGFVNSEGSIRALQTVKDLFESGFVADTIIGGGGIGTFEGYAENIYSMILAGPWAWPIIRGQYPDAEINAVVFPAGDGGSRSVVGGENIVITETSEHKAASWEFVKYMTSHEVQKAFVEVSQMPVLKSLVEDQVIIEHPYFHVFMQQLTTAVARSPHPGWNQINDIMDQAWQDVIVADYGVKESLDYAVELIERVLAEYR
ncbi:extracellular solute-binding protein [Mesotoga prima]|uniref:extracellular solute-binding protein n=1 Tax=Mesotoga prima TaxID=1184387 RepID=UPI002FE17445